MDTITVHYRAVPLRYTHPPSLDSGTYSGILDLNEVLNLVGIHNTIRYADLPAFRQTEPVFTFEAICQLYQQRTSFPLIVRRTWYNSEPDLYLIERESFQRLNDFLKAEGTPLVIKDNYNTPVNLDKFFSYLP